MPRIDYLIVQSRDPLRESSMEQLGQEGWRLGGVAQTRGGTCHFYFWKELPEERCAQCGGPAPDSPTGFCSAECDETYTLTKGKE